MIFLPVPIFLKGRVERKVLHCDEGIPFGRFFFNYLDLLPADLGPRPGRQHFYIYIYMYAEMCSQNTQENDQHQSFL